MSYCVKCGVELDEGAERARSAARRRGSRMRPSRAISRPSRPRCESIAQSRRRTANGDARVRVALLRAAESHFTDGAPLGALRRGRGSDAVDLVRTADARARHPNLLPTDGGRRRHRHLRVDHLRCAARGRWFRGFVLPMLGWACVVVFLLSFLLRDGRRSRLSSIAMCIGAVGLMAMGVEYCLDRYFLEVWQPSWSLVVLVICIGLIIPLRIVRRVPSLREEARRRFNM